MDNGTSPKGAVGSKQCGLPGGREGGMIWILGSQKRWEELVHLKALSCDTRFNVGASLQQIGLTGCWFSSWELGHAN